jgi:DNA polymerase-4
VSGAPHRTILHVDMDAFYVSVELRRHPELRGKPVVVGGAAERGVVAAASYEARSYGVHSAIASVRAKRLCPDLVFLPGDHALYGEVSRQVHEIFRSVTPLVEPIALDEAFLDVTGSMRLYGSGVEIGHSIRNRIHDELDITCSVGVATSKFIAKLASEQAKPKASPQGPVFGPGVVEIAPGRELVFLHRLPVSALWGVGPATLSRLQRIGITTVRDLALAPPGAVSVAVGKASARHLQALANGIDDRPVEPERDTKSIGHEETFAADLYTREAIHTELVRICDSVATRLRGHGVAARTLQLKIKYADFRLITRSVTMTEPVNSGPGILKAIDVLLAGVDPAAGVRLVGVSGSNFGSQALQQLSMDALFAPVTDSPVDAGSDGKSGWDKASTAIDEVRSKFGSGAIGPVGARRTGNQGPNAGKPNKTRPT